MFQQRCADTPAIPFGGMHQRRNGAVFGLAYGRNVGPGAKFEEQAYRRFRVLITFDGLKQNRALTVGVYSVGIQPFFQQEAE